MSATSSVARGLEAALVAVGRLVGPGLVAVAGAHLCTDGMSWVWFGAGLIGAALTVARTTAPSSIEISHLHEVSGRIDIPPVAGDPLRVEMEPEELELRRVAEGSSTPSSTPALSLGEDLTEKTADLASLLMNLGYKKGLAQELAREAVTRAPGAALEDLVKTALSKRRGET